MARNKSAVPNAANETGVTVVALFTDRAAAEAALRDLLENRFTKDQLGVVMRSDQGEPIELPAEKATEGAAKGIVAGGILGGLLGLLASLLIPGLGPIVAGGVLASLLAGAGIGAATGGVIGLLAGLGLSEEEARHFEAGFNKGGVLLTVNAEPGRAAEAQRILDRHGADLGPSQAMRQREAARSEERSREAREREDVIAVAPDAGLTFGGLLDDRFPEPWRGEERRCNTDPNYTGRERRVATA